MSTCSAFKSFQRFQLVPLEDRVVLDGEIAHEFSLVIDGELFNDKITMVNDFVAVFSDQLDQHVLLEREFVDVHRKEVVLSFALGYVSNWFFIGTLGLKVLVEVVVLSNEVGQVAVVKGVKFSHAYKVIWKHNDSEDLDRKLKVISPIRPKIVAFEFVCSIDGVRIVGLHCPRGGGISEELGLSKRMTLMMGSPEKSYGLMGGYVTGSKLLCDFISSFASGFIFTTALPQAVTTGVKAPVGCLKPSRLERKHQQKQAQKLRHDLGGAGKPHRLNPSHSIPVMTKDSVKCEIASDNIIYKFKNK